MTTLLAIDTSTEACSVALLYQNQITHDFILSQRDHTKQVLPMVDRLLKQADCHLSQIDAIAFGKGPGSFTGVRIGIGVAQGIALGIDRPMIGVSTLMTLAQGALRLYDAKKVISAIDARMDEVYLGAYELTDDDQWQAGINECVIKPAEVAEKLQTWRTQITDDIYATGTGWQVYPTMLQDVILSTHHLPDSQDMIKIAETMYAKGDFTKVEDVEPTYLRNEVTWRKLPGR
ncbi:tRNA (adenosine(37)-N6)-threonylcarbamoyltransferase complex dimerization subunit type 1 TsaB [Orbaceae bacterium ac157xtp]